jgi:hypothetical protein
MIDKLISDKYKTFRWFIEKHKLYRNIRFDGDFYCVIIFDDKFNPYYQYKTYTLEQAERFAIKQMIKIVKDRNSNHGSI